MTGCVKKSIIEPSTSDDDEFFAFFRNLFEDGERLFDLRRLKKHKNNYYGWIKTYSGDLIFDDFAKSKTPARLAA